jgi:phthalate 4,5-cis-dihydrodiol dehydrogenase
MAEASKEHRGFTLVAGADLEVGLRTKFAEHFDAVVTLDAASLCERSDLDVIFIATPHQFHAEHVMLALDCGKHVIVEKPMALNLDDCDRMIESSIRNGAYLVVGHTHGFDPTVMALHDLIGSGSVGPLHCLSMWAFTDFIYRPRRPEELDSTRGGGIMFNQIPHQIDIARTLNCSPVRSVRGTTSCFDLTRPTEGLCSAFIEFADGAVCTLTYSGYDRFDTDELHDWTGESGHSKSATYGVARRRIKSIGANELQVRKQGYGYAPVGTRPSHQPHFGLLIASCREADLRTTAAGFAVYDESGRREVVIPIDSPRPGHARVLDELRAAVCDGVPPMHDGTFGRATLKTCLSIIQSADERREIMLDSTS